ncbi:NlpC/P60 family protein [Kaarinaea lacus]
MRNSVAQNISLFFMLSLFLFGCSSTPEKQRGLHVNKMNIPIASKPLSKQQSAVYKKLNTHYQRWRGTPYELGGMNKDGIDCSGFVHVAFRDAFGMKLPRTTEALSRHGSKINKNQLKVGDLVFFKTGRKQQHVGIYVGNKHFIHASTSNGVMKSNLTNPYWIKHYWKSTRLLAN